MSEFERMHDREGKNKSAQIIFIQSFYKSLQQVFVRTQIIKNPSSLNERFEDVPLADVNKWIKLISKSHFDQIAAVVLFIFFKIELKDISKALDVNIDTIYFRINQLLQSLETMFYEF
jgi:hypothetical protein